MTMKLWQETQDNWQLMTREEIERVIADSRLNTAMWLNRLEKKKNDGKASIDTRGTIGTEQTVTPESC